MIVEVSARSVTMPAKCACCGSAADARVQASHEPTPDRRGPGAPVVWMFPSCGACAVHVRTWRSVAPLARGVLGGGALGAVALSLVAPAVGAATLGAAVALAAALVAVRRRRARAQCTPRCPAPGPAVRYLGWDGSAQQFFFAAHSYGTAFVASNGRASTAPPVGGGGEGRRAIDIEHSRASRPMAVPALTPPQASSPKAEPPERTKASTVCTVLSGRRSSVSRLPGAPPRTSTAQTVG